METAELDIHVLIEDSEMQCCGKDSLICRIDAFIVSPPPAEFWKIENGSKEKTFI